VQGFGATEKRAGAQNGANVRLMVENPPSLHFRKAWAALLQ
jgi:hypothetical protein